MNQPLTFEETAILGKRFALRTVSSRLSILSLAALLVGCSSTSGDQMSAGGSGGQGGNGLPHAGATSSGTGGVSGSGGTSAGTGGTSAGTGGTSGGAGGSAVGECAPPPTSYANLFVTVSGKTQAESDQKVATAWSTLFNPSG